MKKGIVNELHLPEDILIQCVEPQKHLSIIDGK